MKSFYLRLFALLLIFCTAARTQDGYVRQPGYDVWHYDLALDISEHGNDVRGEATIRIVVRESNSSELRLDLKKMSVAAVRIAQQALPFKYDGYTLAVVLPAGYKSGDTLQLAISYSGTPQDGLIIRNNKFGRRVMFADNWPDRASFWFPAIDHPSDKATVDFRLTVPAHLTVVANGLLQEVRASRPEHKTWHWRERTPIPTYCMVFGAAEFAVGSLAPGTSFPVSYYVFPEEAAHAQQNFGRVPEMIDFFTKRIGEFPYEKLALVQSVTRFGGMENASVVFFAENSFGKDLNFEGTTAHEIAHQWFGDAVTPAGWQHLWLSEGFATYGEALFYEYTDGPEKFREKMAARRETYLQFAQQHPHGRVLEAGITDYMQLLNASNYSKGAWVLHMLREFVGEENFWLGLRTYYARFRNDNATTDDLLVVMEEVSGDSLKWFFKQWLEQPGHPQVQISWQWHPLASSLEVTLRQTQEEHYDRLPIEIGWQAGSENGLEHMEMVQSEQKMRIKAPRMPDRIVVDPQVKTLMAFKLMDAGAN